MMTSQYNAATFGSPLTYLRSKQASWANLKSPKLALLTIAVSLWVSGCVSTTTLVDADDYTIPQSRAGDAAKANYDLAIGYTSQGQLGVAEEKLIKAISFDDNYYQAYNALGVIYEQTQNISRAARVYSFAAMDPDYHLAKLNYARLLCAYPTVETDSIEKAIGLYETVASDTTGNISDTARVGVGACHAKNNNLAAAEQVIGSVLASNPNLPIALLEMADVQFKLGRSLQAQQLLSQYVSVQGADARAVQIAEQNGLQI